MLSCILHYFCYVSMIQNGSSAILLFICYEIYSIQNQADLFQGELDSRHVLPASKNK